MTTESGAGIPDGRTSDAVSRDVRWPLRLAGAARALHDGRHDAGSREAAFVQVWSLANSFLFSYIRIHARRYGAVSREEIEDLAAQKSLEIANRAECGSWNPENRTPGQIVSFMISVARHGLLDLVRKREKDERWREDNAEAACVSPPQVFPGPEQAVERRAFADALLDCLAGLDGRARLIWYLRVFCGFSSRESAEHPRIKLKAAHVDVIYHRTRTDLQACMLRKGYEADTPPPGTFALLWLALREDEEI